jgi:putative transposase
MIKYKKEKIHGSADRIHPPPARSRESVKGISREHCICDATFYNWKAKYDGIQVSDIKRMKDLEEEKSQLKRIVANQTLEIDAIKAILEKKYGGLTTKDLILHGTRIIQIQEMHK